MVLAITVICFIVIQVLEVSQQYSDVSEKNYKLSVTKHVGKTLRKDCTDTLPVPFGVRIFPGEREVRHFVFLKVHKAASGTATCLFFRFGITRKISFVLPKHLNIISSSDFIKEKAIHPRRKTPFGILTSHMIYNRTAVENFVAKDAVYIGILREPYQQFKSSMNYMQPKYVYNLSNTSPIQEYLKDPLKHERANVRGPRFSWLNNRQAVEFGFPDDVIMNKNQTAITNYIKKLDKEFQIVLIAEYFDESIVLLRRMFNWNMKDILYRNLHIRGWDRKITLPRPRDRELFRKWASIDYSLYDFFFKRLWRQIHLAGADFHEEVLYFKQVRAEVEDFCKVTPNITGTYKMSASSWNEGFTIDAEFCRLMFSEEEDFVKMIAEIQYNIRPTHNT